MCGVMPFSSEAENLTFDVGSHAMPHPRKKTMGEDAHFILPQHVLGHAAALGVADGVGGAADSAWYSAILMANCEALLRESDASDERCPHSLLQMAWANARSTHAIDGRSRHSHVFRIS